MEKKRVQRNRELSIQLFHLSRVQEYNTRISYRLILIYSLSIVLQINHHITYCTQVSLSYFKPSLFFALILLVSSLSIVWLTPGNEQEKNKLER